ncbi:MAG: sulfotransferase domain-containing protein [Proteobacteria bacterium]|nr:sulfotransferase domain-containing protein [Pseudomonadota bacterium]
MSWTISEARRKRAKDAVRRSELRSLFGKRIEQPLANIVKRTAPFLQNKSYNALLGSIARRMNRHQKTAFATYAATDTDVICSAYFKAGTNWVMHICYQITQHGAGQFEHIQDVISWPDAAEPRYWRALTDSNAATAPSGKRVIKSHLSADLVPLDSKAKFVVVTRDPLDCAASGFHFYASLILGPFTPPPDVWLKFFLSDKTFYGPWHKFTASWWAARNRPNVLFLRFEDIKADSKAAIREIAQFLEITLTDSQVQCVASATSFQSMRDINHKFEPVRQTIWSAADTKIIRKGTVGDGNSLFSPEAVQAFREQTAKGLERANSDFPFYGLLRAGAPLPEKDAPPTVQSH